MMFFEVDGGVSQYINLGSHTLHTRSDITHSIQIFHLIPFCTLLKIAIIYYQICIIILLFVQDRTLIQIYSRILILNFIKTSVTNVPGHVIQKGTKKKEDKNVDNGSDITKGAKTKNK